ncbi:MAG: hypothetical protein ACRD4L_02250, partial [Pyrinomonadaceae bacterium]
GMEELTKTSPEYNTLQSFIKPIFAEKEWQELKRKDGGGSIWLSLIPQRKKNVPLFMTKAYRSKATVKDATLYYIEAKKEYTKLPTVNDAGCPNTSVLQVWVTEDSLGRMNVKKAMVDLTDCDWKTVEDVRSFATIKIDNREFIVSVKHGWEDENYVIYEISQAGFRQLLKTNAGGC